MKVVIVGAGPSGLVTCKSVLEARTAYFPFDPVILEQEDSIGGTFQYRTYDFANLVSSKQLTSFSDYRFPLASPDHPSVKEYLEYLNGYVEHFNLGDRISFNSKVVNIKRTPSGRHEVSFLRRINVNEEWSSSPQIVIADYIAICAGLHVVPSIPNIAGIQHVLNSSSKPGKNHRPSVFHSIDYKSRSQLTGRHVMILGTGETGMDIAYEAVKAGAEQVVLCSRSGFLSFPRALNDFEIFGFKFASRKPVPIDSLITNLGETAYVHPWIAQSHIRWFISDFVIKYILWFLTGTRAGCNQWVGELDSRRLGRAYVFLNKSHKAMPYLNRPHRTRPWYLEYISRYIDPWEDSPPQTSFVVELAPFPSHFLENGRVVFGPSERKDAVRISKMNIFPDTVIYATGYTQEFDYFDKDGNYPLPGDANMRNVAKNGDEDIAFIGYVRPGVGAIPPLSEMQALFWISLIKGQVQLPLSPPHYHLLIPKEARIQYGVDHSSYASTLAQDINASPGLFELWKYYGFKVLLCYCFGAAFTPFYRLVGPFQSRMAPKVIKYELWETITRRGIAGNILMGVIPMIFYLTLNFFAYVVGLMW